MAAPLPNRMDTRAALLADRMVQSAAVGAQALTPAGQPAPFTTRMPKGQAMDWWLDNWDKPYAQELRNALPMQQQLELNVALSDHIAQKQQATTPPLPTEWGAPSSPLEGGF